MKIITFIFRYFVGSLFIFSGLIKLNDPICFSFKLEEYFGPTVFDIDFLVPLVLPMAIFIVIFEVVLGIFLILGYKKEDVIEENISTIMPRTYGDLHENFMKNFLSTSK